MLFYTYTHLIIAAGKVQFCFLYYIVFSCSLFFLSFLVCSPRFCLAKMRFPRFSCCVLLIGQAVLKILLRHAFFPFFTPAFALLNVPLIQKAVFSIDAPVMLSPGSLRACFRAFSVPTRSFSSVSISPMPVFPFCVFPSTPSPKAPCSSAFVCKPRPGLLPVISFTRIPFLLLYPPYLLCSRLFFYANLVFLPHKLHRRSSFPPLYTNALSPSPKQTLCAFSLVRLHSFCLVLTPCPVCAVCYARFGFPNGKRRPRFLPFFTQNKRGRLALFVHCAVLFFLSASIHSGRYFSTLALCSSSVLLNTVSPVSGSPRQKYKYPFK